MSIQEIQTAIEHHRSGRLQQAERAYRQILAREPSHVDAMHGLGTIALQAGRPEQALKLISAAVALRPDSMAFQSNLGMVYQALKRYSEAETAFRRATELAPEVAGPLFNLANLLKEQNRLADAVALYLKVIQLQNDHVSAHNNLGNCYKDQGRLDEARQSLTRAIQLKADFAEAYLNLANVLTNAGQPIEAESHCREALRLQPQLGAAYVCLGTTLFAQKRKEEAAKAFHQATQLSPTIAEAHENYGMSLADLGRLADAITAYRRAVDVAPNRAESWRRLGNGLMTQRQIAEGDDCFRRADQLQPEDPSSLSQWMFWQLYRPEVSLASIAARHAEWNARYRSLKTVNQKDGSGASQQDDSQNDKSNCDENMDERKKQSGLGNLNLRKRLRLGFVSADFGQHPVGMFTIRTFEALSSLGFEICCYSTSARSSPIHNRFRKCAAQWKEVQHLPDDALADQIVSDRIDILIDLAGHSAGNRLGTFARCPAPIQATWIASEGTTGLSAMDYLIADEHVVPREAEPFYCESVVRLPISYVSWDPPAEAPAVAPLPAATRQSIIFGSFNNPAKYHAGVAELWSRILHRVQDSRLILQSRHLMDHTLQKNLLDLFTEQGVDVSRIEFRDWQPYAELLESYSAIDIALDPFPFGGGATTCEALWMGVPVVTWPGETYSSRHSLSYLSTIGLNELIAGSQDDYVEIAVALATDLSRLSSLRTSLRRRIESSPLCDGHLCAEGLAKVLREMWDSKTP